MIRENRETKRTHGEMTNRRKKKDLRESGTKDRRAGLLGSSGWRGKGKGWRGGGRVEGDNVRSAPSCPRSPSLPLPCPHTTSPFLALPSLPPSLLHPIGLLYCTNPFPDTLPSTLVQGGVLPQYPPPQSLAAASLTLPEWE